MATVARLESSLAFNDSEFTAGIVRAEQRAATFSNRVGKHFESLFKRSPGRRAEQAVSNLVGDLASGNVAGGVANLAARISGLGLGVGVAIGAGVEVFEKFRGQIEETNKSAEKLESLLREPLALKMKLPEGDVLKGIEERMAAVKDFQSKSESWGDWFKNLGGSLPGNVKGDPVASNDDANKRQVEANKLLADARILSGKRVQDLADEVRFHQEALTLGESQAAIDEMRYRLGQKIAETQERAVKLQLPAGDTKKEIASLKKRELLGESGIFQKEKLGTDEFEDSKKLLGIKRLGASPENEAKLTAGFKLQATNRQLERTDINLPPEERRRLTLQKMSQENDVRQFKPKDTTQKNPFAYGTIANRNWEDENGRWGSLATQDKETKDPTAYGSLAYNAVQRGEAPLPPDKANESAQVVEELRKLTGLFEQAWKE